MSDLDDLKNDAEKYAKDHPQQVQEGEQEIEKKLDPADAGGSKPADSGKEDQAPAGSPQDQATSGDDSAAGEPAASR
jgi:hypothetical protein